MLRSPRRRPHGAANPTWISWKSAHLFPPVKDKEGRLGKTPSLVMSPAVQRFHCCRQDRRACGRQHHRDEPSAMGWNERRVVHMPSAGHTKFADCDAHEDTRVIGMQLSRLCVPGLHWAAQGEVNYLRIAAGSCSREGAVRTECRCCARRELAARQEGAAARTSCVARSPQNCSGGVRFSGQRVGLQFYE